MSDSRAKSAAKQIGMLGVLTVVVTLLTILFNLCGTLSVSVISGMMTGTSRRWKWQAIPISLVPSIVVLALGRITRVELELPQRLSLAGVCLGAFWGTYLVTVLLMCLEKKDPAIADQAAQRHSPVRREAGASTSIPTVPPGTPLPDGASRASAFATEFNVEQLQGTWLCEADPPKEPPHKRVFAITKDKFSFSVVNSSGRPQLIAQGDVIVENGSLPKRLVLAANATEVKKDGGLGERISR